MNENSQLSEPQDICLLLRTHGEQRWLIYELLPVLRQIETPGSVPEEQLGAALAYLELLWLEAQQRARETDTAHANLTPDGIEHDVTLYEKACRYHAAVCRLRTAIGSRIQQHMLLATDFLGHEHAGH